MVDWLITVNMSHDVVSLVKLFTPVVSMTGVPRLSLAMYPFSISIDERVPTKISYDERAEENNKNMFTNKHMIFKNNIH